MKPASVVNVLFKFLLNLPEDFWLNKLIFYERFHSKISCDSVFELKFLRKLNVIS